MLMLWIGAYAQVMQALILGDPGTVTRDQLGHLGGNPHFRPPAPDPWTEAKQGLSVSSTDRCGECGWGGGGIRDEGCLISWCPRHPALPSDDRGDEPHDPSKYCAIYECKLEGCTRAADMCLSKRPASSMSSPDRGSDA